MNIYTATQAIEQTVKARIKELETGKLNDECPLCDYAKKITGFWGYSCLIGEFNEPCPVIILTGKMCPKVSDFHHKDPEMGVSFALALQYYYDIYKKTGKTLKG